MGFPQHYQLSKDKRETQGDTEGWQGENGEGREGVRKR